MSVRPLWGLQTCQTPWTTPPICPSSHHLLRAWLPRGLHFQGILALQSTPISTNKANSSSQHKGHLLLEAFLLPYSAELHSSLGFVVWHQS